MPDGGVVSTDEAALLPRLGPVRLRPLAPADRPAYCAFGAKLAREDLRLRFAGPVKLDNPAFCARLLAIDHDQIEVIAAFGVTGAILGVGRLVRTAPALAEIALIVRSDLKRRGLGRLLLDALAHQARRVGIRVFSAQVLHENYPMLQLAVKAGARPVGLSGLFVDLRFDLPPFCDFQL